MEEYNDGDNTTSIVIRAKERSRACSWGSRFAQKQVPTYLLKDLTLCADRCWSKMGSPDITVLDLFSSVKGTVNFKCLELRSQRVSSSGPETKPSFPPLALIKPVFYRMASKKHCTISVGVQFAEHLSPWQGRDLVLSFPSWCLTHQLSTFFV